MALDPNIILSGRQPDLIGARVKKQNLQNAIQGNEMNQIKLDEYRTGQERTKNLRNILSNTPEDQLDEQLRRGGYIDELGAMGKMRADKQKLGIESQKAQAEQKAAEFKIKKEKNQLVGQAMGFLKDNPSVESLQSTLEGLVNQGVMSPEEAQAAFEKGPKDPDGIRNLATQHFQSALDVDKQLSKIETQDMGGFKLTRAINPVTNKVTEVARNYEQDPNKPFNLDPATGRPVANQPFQDFEKSKAKSGAANTSIKIENKTGESLAKEVGGMMKDSTAIADGAVKQIDAAQRVVKAVNSGNLITGPAAGVRLKANQLAQIFGVGGKDDAERIANTREVLRGFAELTLQGRQQMKGQGAITESEGRLAEKAMSGDIEDLTAAEIKQLAKASERAARFNYSQYDRKMKTMRSDPNLQGLTPYYEAAELPPEVADTPASNHPPEIKSLLEKYGR